MRQRGLRQRCLDHLRDTSNDGRRDHNRTACAVHRGTGNNPFYLAPTNINAIDLIPNALANVFCRATLLPVRARRRIRRCEPHWRLLG